MPISNLFGPIIALNGWTFVMEGWMYGTRLPEFTRLNVAADNTQTHSQIDLKTSPSVRWKADNFNNLLEQPTQFYAIALVLALARQGQNSSTDAYLAWAYVGVRVLHSLVHATTNNIRRRFTLYVLSSGIAAALAGRAAMLVF
ncbi:membrane-associated, eicosanoid/glutathione metabolism protein [Aspergillus ambiguus]|uniref:MAPEG family protein n=1 Tax=Aspergillus ambiguus TaxID=176160 RepID=UPI003CCC971E